VPPLAHQSDIAEREGQEKPARIAVMKLPRAGLGGSNDFLTGWLEPPLVLREGETTP